MGLTVNREKTKLLNLDAERSSLTFLGYEFRKVRDRLFGTGKRYLHFGPSPKSVKRVCQEVHKHTHSRNVLLTVDVVVDRVNKLLEGWGVSPALPARTRYVLIEIDDVSPNKLASIEEVEIQSRVWGGLTNHRRMCYNAAHLLWETNDVEW